uniref:Uncharacterized protein n=1 Tax=Daucus carota subsp. sativus TaxID=79200 RepID=A0A161WTI4_DAUCS
MSYKDSHLLICRTGGRCPASAVSLCYLCSMHPKPIMSGNASKLRKGAWGSDEDTLLRRCIEEYGEEKWHLVPQRAGLNRCRKSCRLRWLNYIS